MNDCISREEALKHSHIEYDYDGEGHRVVYFEDIENLPSVTPKQKIGRWLNINESEKWECSECGRMMWFSPRLGVKPSDYNYCPNCGAKMAESEDKE